MMKIELGIGAPLVDRSRNGVEARTMSASEVRKARPAGDEGGGRTRPNYKYFVRHVEKS